MELSDISPGKLVSLWEGALNVSKLDISDGRMSVKGSRAGEVEVIEC